MYMYNDNLLRRNPNSAFKCFRFVLYYQRSNTKYRNTNSWSTGLGQTLTLKVVSPPQIGSNVTRKAIYPPVCTFSKFEASVSS